MRNARNITANCRGYKEYHAGGKTDLLPKMFGFQAAGAAPIVDGHPIEHPQTVASAIRIGNPASWQGAVDAAKESDGHIRKVPDEEILAAYRLAARTEGIFAEPASATPLAGLIRCGKDGQIPEGSLIAVTLTGHGLKDPDVAISEAGFAPTVVPPTKEAVLKVLGL